MESIVERINQNKFWHFHGGIHPPEQKKSTNEKPIRQLSLPKQLILPLQQHIGRQGDLLVKVGDKVLKGQALTQSSNPMAVPVHAPTSGTISAIKKSVIAHPSGLSELCLFIDVDGEDTWRERNICQDFSQLSHQQIIGKIANAGIAGMGGAGFPTHIKVNTKPDINFLIINAAECEPYITADDLLMREHSTAIIDGIKILDQLLNPAFILIGIEDNKPQAIKALKHATESIEKIKVCVLETKYPSGGEKQLIKLLTGKEVASGALPIHSGIVVQNVATCFAISEAVINDTPLIRRVVTLAGQALAKPQNVWALLGTPVSYLLEQAGFVHEGQKQLANPPVIMGGPMMGFSILNENVPVVKTSNCILAPSKTEMPSAFDNNTSEVECIRCGQCAEVCPSQLLPQELQWSAKAKDHQQLTKLNLFDCIDCGACAYVCPSHIPLVQYYRVAKAEIRQQQQLDLKAEKAKERFEARKLRLEREKIAREEKHKKAAAARKAAMNKKTPEAGAAKSAVAAALARVKAKKAAGAKAQEISAEPQEVSNQVQDEKSQVKAAIARAKAKKEAKNKAVEPSVTPDVDTKQLSESSVSKTNVAEKAAPHKAADDKKAKIAAAIAKAKEKAKVKKAQEAELPTSAEAEKNPVGEQVKQTNVDDKKAKIAAAVAKAKAKAKAKAAEKKQAPASITENNSEEIK
ncbi:MAG: electron transport complex subunit RsxC [Colwellia sp.]|nr:electron transport complex subunit RsxC [Colwellia sp.]MCW8863415.1 electron transport complex subunit RsxC [Colwellia sp.]